MSGEGCRVILSDEVIRKGFSKEKTWTRSKGKGSEAGEFLPWLRSRKVVAMAGAS